MLARESSSTAGQLQMLWVCTEVGVRKALCGFKGKLSHGGGTANIPVLALISSVFISPGDYSQAVASGAASAD